MFSTRLGRVQAVRLRPSYWRWGGDSLTGWPSQPTSNFVTASMDEVAVYNKQLSDQQVAWHYAADG